MASITGIVFVCLGNIARSPLAENMFAHLAEEAGQSDNYRLDSAGTSSYHIGESPDKRMRQVAAENGLIYNGKARQFYENDFDDFDLIIVMDTSNRKNLKHLTNDPEKLSKIHLMREFDPEGDPDKAVPDPYYGGLDGFQETYAIVERSCRGLLEALNSGKLGNNDPN